MTQEQFDNTKFGAGMTVKYRGGLYGVVSVNFYEKLLGIIDVSATGEDADDDLTWVRCESVEVYNG